MTLPLNDFDFKPFGGIIEAVQSRGIHFVPYSMLGDSTENKHRLYDLTVALERDVPNSTLGLALFGKLFQPFQAFALVRF